MFHTIEIGDAHPFRLKQRPISFVTQQYLEQEVEKLISDRAIFHADSNVCFYTSRAGFAPKNDRIM